MTWGTYTSGTMTQVDPNSTATPGQLYETRLTTNRDLTSHEQAAAESSILRDYTVYQNADVKYIGFVNGSPQETVIQFVPRASAGLGAGGLAAVLPAILYTIIAILIAVLVTALVVGAIIVTGSVVYVVAKGVVGVSSLVTILVGAVFVAGAAYVVYRIWKGQGIPRPKIPKIPEKITIPKIPKIEFQREAIHPEEVQYAEI